ncbi:MAG: general secretion pathway protein GspG [Chlamydiia bacterium]|nr:general secretion pathway protein GspG [Chlamydiia bacterium]
MLVIRRSFVTLIEMMIVMFLIALILGVVAYNYRGSLEEGKAFKSRVGREKLETILNMAVAQDPALGEHIDDRWQDVVRSSPLVQNPDALIRDGWGNYYEVEVSDGVVRVRSTGLEQYERKR